MVTALPVPPADPLPVAELPVKRVVSKATSPNVATMAMPVLLMNRVLVITGAEAPDVTQSMP